MTYILPLAEFDDTIFINTAQYVEVYNSVANKPIKRFANRQVAYRRARAALEAYWAAVEATNAAQEAAIDRAAEAFRAEVAAQEAAIQAEVAATEEELDRTAGRVPAAKKHTAPQPGGTVEMLLRKEACSLAHLMVVTGRTDRQIRGANDRLRERGIVVTLTAPKTWVIR